MAGFDRDLFLALAPPFPKIELKKFTGSETGDEVHIRFKSPVNKDWISDITDHGIDEKEAYFVDVGRVVPPPLKTWKHRHIVRKISETESEIIDDIEFSSGFAILNVLMYPALLIGFLPRKRIYKKFFSSID
jgi:ligand-binding SRPBCC domain-containing protein